MNRVADHAGTGPSGRVRSATAI